MKMKLEKITPETARGMLKGNTRNRQVREKHVDFLASEMTSGRWRTTSEAIAIAPDGTIVDGQHRLLAVTQSGVTVDAWVCYDAPLETQDVIDCGTIRTVPDQLHLSDGLSNANIVVGAARHIAAICCGMQFPKLSVGAARFLIAEYEKEIRLVTSHFQKFKPAMKTWFIGSMAFALSADKGLMPFIEAIGSGENLKSGDPAKTLRDWLTNSSRSTAWGARGAMTECAMNCAFNAAHGNRLTIVKRGAIGVDYFTAKKRRSVATIRAQLEQQQEFAAA